jgi:hypothetical protein
VIFFIRKINWTIQAKKPASFRRPTKTIIPTRKRITSKEANFITFSRSIVRVINNIEVPKKTNPKRKSQKNKVPNTEAKKIDIASDCWEFKPILLVKIPKPIDVVITMANFLNIFIV